MTEILFRRGTSQLASANNPVLKDGEPGWEKDTRIFKIGDGVTPWSDLPSISGSTVDSYMPVGHWEALDLTQAPAGYLNVETFDFADELPTGASAQAITDNGDGTLTLGAMTGWLAMFPLPEWTAAATLLDGNPGSLMVVPWGSEGMESEEMEAVGLYGLEGTWSGRLIAFKEAISQGDHSHAEGYASHAEGTSSHAEGTSSHAEGENSHAEGYASHAQGYSSHAQGYASHAEGYNTHAEGYASHAEGYSRWGKGAGQTVRQPLVTETGDSTPTPLYDPADNPARIGADHAAAFAITTTCRSADGAVAAAWRTDGFMVTNTAGDPTVTTQPPILLGTHGDVTGLAVTATSGDPGSRAIAVTVTGQAGISFHWYATVEWQEVG